MNLACVVLLFNLAMRVAGSCCSTCAGTLPLDEAARVLATEEDYSEYVEQCEQLGDAPCSKAAYRLDMPTAYSRMLFMDDSTDGVFVSNVMNASPGEVVASNGNLVQYRCTTLPQMSGCPCKSLLDHAIMMPFGQLGLNLFFAICIIARSLHTHG